MPLFPANVGIPHGLHKLSRCIYEVLLVCLEMITAHALLLSRTTCIVLHHVDILCVELLFAFFSIFIGKYCSITSEEKQSNSVSSDIHGLTGRVCTNSNSVRVDALNAMIMATIRILDDHGIEPPWKIPTQNESNPTNICLLTLPIEFCGIWHA